MSANNDALEKGKVKNRHYRFKDCLEGDFVHPCTKKESLAFDILFVIGMATTMVLTVNFAIKPLTMGSTDPAYISLLNSIKMLPGLCAVALAARLIYADRLSNWVMKRFIAPNFRGLVASTLLVCVNVFLMAPPMCASAVLIAGAPPIAILQAFKTVFPYAAMAGFVLAMVCIRPLVMMVFSNVLAPRYRHETDC